MWAEGSRLKEHIERLQVSGRGHFLIELEAGGSSLHPHHESIARAIEVVDNLSWSLAEPAPRGGERKPTMHRR